MRIAFGGCVLDPATGELLRPNVPPILLGARPTRLLALLASRHGELVSRDEIQRAVWTDGTTVDFDQSINQHVRQLRQLLGDDAAHPTWIQTLPGRGYRFLVAAERIGAAPAPVDVPTSSAPSRARRRPRAAFAIAAAIAVVCLFAVSDRASTPGARDAGATATVRLAVLPLATDDPRGLAVADEVITVLGEQYAPGLEVIALRSVRGYRDAATPIATIARELDVAFVLDGSLRAGPDRVRIDLRLIRARDAAQVWARVFEEPVQPGWALESTIAQDVASALGRVLLPGRTHPDVALDADARVAYLRGTYLLANRRPRDAATAFTEVTTRSPRSARGWAALALAELRSAQMTAAATAANTALALDPANADAHDARGLAALYGEWDPERARRHLLAAIAANPSFAEAHHDLAAAYSALGRNEDAIAEMQRAFALDPRAPEVVSDVGWYYYFAKRYGEAATWCERTLALDATFYWAHRCIVLAKQRANDPAGATAAALADLHARDAPPSVRDEVAASGLAAYWRYDLLRDRADPTDRAVDRLALGDRDGALAELDRAVVQHRGWLLPFLAVDPTFDALRGDPRFAAVLGAVAVARPIAPD